MVGSPVLHGDEVANLGGWRSVDHARPAVAGEDPLAQLAPCSRRPVRAPVRVGSRRVRVRQEDIDAFLAPSEVSVDAGVEVELSGRA